MSFADDNVKAWSEIVELHKSRPDEFGNTETANGPGATLAQTEALREILPEIFKRYGIKTVLDVGCGDWNWMSQVDLSGVIEYIGWDVEASMIREDKERYEDEHVRFFDTSLLTCDMIPSVDLILARHVLIHFPNDEIVKALDKMRASGARYLLTSHWENGSNEDYEPEGLAWRGYMERALDMEAPPFNLPTRIEAIHEPAADAGVLMQPHELALFELIPAPGITDDWLADNGYVDLGTASPAARRSPEGCEHTSTYRVHRADDTVATVCVDCQGELDAKGEAGGVFSFHDTIARWAADVEKGGLGKSDKAARMQGRPISRNELLRGLRDEHREILAAAGIDNSQETIGRLLRVHGAILDAILGEMLGERDG
jgi:SAM-dependent methyltransferase